MRFLIYNLILALLAPATRWWLRRDARRRSLADRFDPGFPELPERPICLHACSLGEVNAARTLVEGLIQAYPGAPIMVTTSTCAGRARAEELYGVERVAWFPFDTRRAVSRFLDRANPRILLLFETELWPNVLSGCRARGIPAVLVNGRLSDRHERRYRWLAWWYRAMVRDLSGACMQTERHAERIMALGAPRERVHVAGNLKFDAVRTSTELRARNQLRAACGMKAGAPVLVFGSTRPGDEALASACWATLREECPELRLVVAPRHVNRAEEAIAPFSEPVIRRSAMRVGGRSRGERVILLDTLGELSDFYAIASVAVIGGSFYPGVNGHNPLEPAALGVPVVFGPYMANFADSAAVLVARGGARQVACPEDLYLALSELLGNAAERRQMGTRARRAVLQNQGATERTVALLASWIYPGERGRNSGHAPAAER